MHYKALFGIASACVASTTAFDPVSVLRSSLSNELSDRELRKARSTRNPYSPRFALKNPKRCPKPLGGRDEEDRYCEASFQPMPACGCKEVCHIWGDPHVSPFFSSCSTVSMHSPGTYTIYELPANDDPNRTPIRIEAKVEKIRSRKTNKNMRFMQELYVTYGSAILHPETLNTYTYDGKRAIMNAKACDDDPNTIFHQKFPLYVGEDQTDSSKNVILEVTSNCNMRHAPHLNVTVAFIDNVGGAESESLTNILGLAAKDQPEKTRTADVLPSSTTRFSDDFGVCTDPKKHGDMKESSLKDPFWMSGTECKRPSGLADGRECSCSQQCAAYGDPRVHAFNEIPIRGNDFFAPVEEPEFRVFYSVAPYYSAVVKVDECAYMVGFYGIYLKNDPPYPEDLSHPDNYLVAEYDADTSCPNEADVHKTTRKTFHAPEKVVSETDEISKINMQVYDEAYNGFDIGKFLVFDDGSTEAIPRHAQPDEALLQHVLNHPREVSSIIDAGGVQVALKCHITDDQNRNEPRKYFNICIERSGVNVDPVPADDDFRRRLKRGALSNDPGVNGLLAIEEAISSGGWCSTGQAINSRKNRFARRTAKEIKIVPFNPEAIKAEACRRNKKNC